MKNIIIKALLYFITFNSILFGQDVLFQSLRDELKRSKENLVFENEKPYFISYSITDIRKISINASFGGIIQSRDSRLRSGSVDIRIGDYKFDNSNFSGSGMFFFNGRFNLPLEDKSYPIKYQLWLATDKAFKLAIDELERKKALLENKSYNDKINDFSKEKPTELLDELNDFAIDTKTLEKEAIEYSNVFRNYPEISKSRVEIGFDKGNNYFINTEGSAIRTPVNDFSIEVAATAMDLKGNRVSDYVSIYIGNKNYNLTKKVILDSINRMAKNLANAVKSPLAEDYNGPVLILNEAAGNFLSQLLTKSLSGRPAPFSTNNTIQSSQLLRKIGKKIFPEFLSVSDDPTISEFNNKPLLGTYRTDDEGVISEKVNIIENGILKNLLMCRKPNSKAEKSNGHGRKDAFRKAEGRISNLIFTSKQNKSYDDLKKELIALCKEQELEYGIIVKKISDVLIFSALVDGFSGSLPNSRSNELFVSAPIEAYKIYVKDGREELVRGLNFANLNLKNFFDISSAGNDYSVYNFISRGNSGDMPSSIVSPSILFDELDLVAEKDQGKKPLILKHPFFTKK